MAELQEDNKTLTARATSLASSYADLSLKAAQLQKDLAVKEKKSAEALQKARQKVRFAELVRVMRRLYVVSVRGAYPASNHGDA